MNRQTFLPDGAGILKSWPVARLLTLLSHPKSRLIPEIFLVLTIAWMISRFILVIITPYSATPFTVTDHPTAQKVNEIEVDLDLFNRFDPFSGTPVQQNDDTLPEIATLESTLDVTVLGYMADSSGQGSIIIERDGTTDTIVVNDEIEPGAFLEKVEAGRAIIRRDGVLESLRITQKDQFSPFASPIRDNTGDRRPGGDEETRGAEVLDEQVTPEAALLDVPLQGTVLDTVFRFEPAEDDPGGISLLPGADSSLFYGLGFKDGDVVRGVNGREFTNAIADLRPFLSSLRPEDGLTVLVDRQGQAVELSIPAAPATGAN